MNLPILAAYASMRFICLEPQKQGLCKNPAPLSFSEVRPFYSVLFLRMISRHVPFHVRNFASTEIFLRKSNLTYAAVDFTFS